MRFQAECLVLKGEARPFTGRDGKQVDYAKAHLLDNEGNVFEAAMTSKDVPAFESLRQKICVCEFELSKSTNKDGKPSMRLKLHGFTVRK